MLGCGTSSDGPQFNKIIIDQNQLNGKWYLYQKIIPNVNTKDSLFLIDSTSYQGKRFTFDLNEMLFSSELYPYTSDFSRYRMSISTDTIKVRSGAFENGIPILKNTYTFMISDDADYLRVYDLKEKNIEIYHNRE